MDTQTTDAAPPLRAQRIYRYADITEVTGLSEVRIKHLVNEGHFPRPIRLTPGGKAVGWPEEWIVQWQQERIAEASAREQERRQQGDHSGYWAGAA